MLQDVDLTYDRTGALATTKTLKAPAIYAGGTLLTPPNAAQPADHGLIAWAADPVTASTTSTLTNGTVYLVSVFLRAASTISKIWWINTAAAVTATAGQNAVGLYSPAGALLSSASTDSIVTVNGVQSATLAAAQNVAAGRYWVGILANASTPPTVARMAGASASANNINLTAATYRFAVNGTSQTSLPASITPGSNTTTGALALWAAVS